MKSVVCAASSPSILPQARTTRRAVGQSVPVLRQSCLHGASWQQPCLSNAPVQQRQVEVRFFKFGKNGFGAEDAGIVGGQGRDDYNYDDVEQYFNYMGFLAEEGTYDRMEAMLSSGLHPIDVILLLACSENDTPKVGEILKAGADVRAKNLDGKTAIELAGKPELLALLKEYEAKSVSV